jgi:hypothetical protein
MGTFRLLFVFELSLMLVLVLGSPYLDVNKVLLMVNIEALVNFLNL